MENDVERLVKELGGIKLEYKDLVAIGLACAYMGRKFEDGSFRDDEWLNALTHQNELRVRLENVAVTINNICHDQAEGKFQLQPTGIHRRGHRLPRRRSITR